MVFPIFLQELTTMIQRMAKTRALTAGAMIFGVGLSGAMAFPDDKPKEQASDLASILEKLPPDVRERLIAEIDRVRAEAEKLKVEAIERGEKLKIEATKRLEEMKRDAQERMERVEVELRRKAETAESNAREQIEKARAQAEVARQRALMAAEKGRAEAAKEHDKHHGEGDRVEKKSVTEERSVIVSGVPLGDGKKSEIKEMRVEVTRKDGQEKPVVRIFKDGKEVKSDELPEGFVFEGLPKLDVLQEVNLEKLEPEKRAEIERARGELKSAQERLRVAAEKLAKIQGGTRGNIMVFRADGKEAMNLRSFMGDRLPGVPLPPGAMGRGDRLPKPPIMPVPPQPPAAPELEKRMSKAEKALDEILLELKKIQENLEEEEEDDDDDDEDEEKEDRKKPKKD